MPTYEYTGDADTVFTTLAKDGHTWVASKGEQITVDEPIGHPLLSLVVDEAPTSVKAPASEPENIKSAVTADKSKEN
jgi:hypothetical protein